MEFLNKIVFLVMCWTVFAFGQDYLWPTNASKALTSSFAESRSSRFHAGIDVKTWGQEGYPLYAIRDGYISRIRVSPYGYGRALYITLDTGEIVIYGHMQKFNAEIEEYVWQQQQQQNSFSVNLWPGRNHFVYKQGELVGYTGQTGIGYPHLHFELRDSANRPINPLSKGYELQDSVRPIVTKIAFFPINAHSQVQGDVRPVILYPQRLAPGQYRITQPITVDGQIGFGVDAYDQMNGISNKFGTYINQLFINDQLVFDAKYDRFSYNVNNHLKLDRDYRFMSQGRGTFYKLYRDRGNRLTFYGSSQPFYGVVDFISAEGKSRYTGSAYPANNGVIQITGEEHELKIICLDFWGNQTEVTGVLKKSRIEPQSSDEPNVSADGDSITAHLTSEYFDTYVRLEWTFSRVPDFVPRIVANMTLDRTQPIELFQTGERTFWGVLDVSHIDGPVRLDVHAGGERLIQWLPFTRVEVNENKEIRSEDGHFSVGFYSSSLFRDVFVRMDQESPVSSEELVFASQAYTLAPQDVALDDGVSLRFTFDPTDSLSDKLAIFARGRQDRWYFVNNKKDHRLRTLGANVTTLGTYALAYDTEPPVLYSLTPSRNARLSDRRPTLRARFADKLSGVSGERNMQLLLDGKRVIAEYDPEKASLFYSPREDLSSGQHSVQIILRDRCGNVTRREHEFFIP